MRIHFVVISHYLCMWVHTMKIFHQSELLVKISLCCHTATGEIIIHSMVWQVIQWNFNCVTEQILNHEYCWYEHSLLTHISLCMCGIIFYKTSFLYAGLEPTSHWINAETTQMGNQSGSRECGWIMQTRNISSHYRFQWLILQGTQV